MRVIRLFHPEPPQIGKLTVLLPEVAHKVGKVLRMREGDSIELVCGDGMNYVGQLVSMSKNAASAEITGVVENDVQPVLDLQLYVALLKGDAMDWVLQKSVELGVTRIVPLETERSERRFNDQRWIKKSKHWQGILTAATLQCGRSDWTSLETPLKISEGVSAPAQVNIICCPHTNDGQIKLSKSAKSVALMIGPEGGFTSSEVMEAQKNGWTALGLGKRILRADTAVVTTLGMAQLFYGDLPAWKK